MTALDPSLLRPAGAGRELDPSGLKPVPNEYVSPGDYLKLGMQGFANLATTVGEGASLLGAGTGLRDIGQNAEDYWRESMTPAGRKIAASPMIEKTGDGSSWDPTQYSLGEHPVQSAIAGAVQSAPSMVGAYLLGAPVAAAGGALHLGGRTALALQNAGVAGPLARTVGRNLVPGAAFGAAEGVQAGLQNAAQTAQEISQLPQEKLDKSPAYQEELAKLDPGVPLSARQAQAREALSRRAEQDIVLETAPLTGGIGALTGGGVMGELARSRARQSIAAKLLHGPGKEALQEGLQSPEEQLVQNLATQKYIDPSQDLGEGVYNAAVAGAVSGGLLGIPGMAGGVRANTKELPGSTQQEKIAASDAANAELAGAADFYAAQQAPNAGLLPERPVVVANPVTGKITELDRRGGALESAAAGAVETGVTAGMQQEDASKLLFPYANRRAAQDYVNAQADPEMFDVEPHPSVQGRFAAVPKTGAALEGILAKRAATAANETSRTRANQLAQEEEDAPPAKKVTKAKVGTKPATVAQDTAGDIAQDELAPSPVQPVASMPGIRQRAASQALKANAANQARAVQLQEEETPKTIDADAGRANVTPTEKQKNAGNFAKGHIRVGGIDIAIENPVGSERTGVEAGKRWKTKLKAHYGYVKRTTGADGDQVDVYVKQGTAPEHDGPVFVVDQYNPGTGDFDETKSFIGYGSQAEAQAAYDAHFGDKSGPKRRGAITQMAAEEFRTWTRKGDTTKPVSSTKFKGQTSDPEQAAQEEIAQSIGLKMSRRRDKESQDAYQTRMAAEANQRRSARVEKQAQPTRESDQKTVAGIVRGIEGVAPEVKVSILSAATRPNAGQAKGVSKQAAQFIEQVARVFKKRVVFFDTDSPAAASDGFYLQGNTIYLGVRSSVAHLRVLGHELTHAMKAQAGDAYDKMLGAVSGLLTEQELRAQHKDYFGTELDTEQLDLAYSGEQTLREFLAEEWIADLSGNRFAETGFWSDVFEQLEAQHGDAAAKGIVARLRLALVKALNKLLALVKGNAFAVDARLADNLEDIRKAIATGFAEYGRRAKADQLAEETPGEVKFKTPTSDVGHRREGSSGRYVGAPDWVGNSPAQLAQLRKKLYRLAKEGEPGRFWYERSSKAILDLVNGDKKEAEKLVQLIAIYSPSNSVPGNTTMAVKAYYQWKQGLPIRIYLGAQDKKANELLYEGKEWEGVKTTSFYANLMAEIDPTKNEGGKATRDMWIALAFDYGMLNFDQGTKYRFAEREIQRLAERLGWTAHQAQAAIWTAMKGRIDPIRGDLTARELDNGWHKPEVQAWWTGGEREKYQVRQAEFLAQKAAGKKAAPPIIKEAGVDTLRPEYRRKHYRLAHEMGMAYDLKAEDVTASGYDFSDAIKQRTAQMSWEAIPGKSTGELAGIHTAPMPQQQEYQAAIEKALTDDKGNDRIMHTVGLALSGSVTGFSGWQGETSVGRQTGFVVPPDSHKGGLVQDVARAAINLAADVRGLVLKQEGVAWHYPIYTGSKNALNGIEFRLDRLLTEEESAALYKSLIDELGHDYSPPIPSFDGLGFRVLNFPDEKFALLDDFSGEGGKARKRELQKAQHAKNAAFVEAVIRAVDRQAWSEEITDSARFETDGELRENDWSKGDGEYRGRIRSTVAQWGEGADRWAGRPDIFEWIDGDLRPAVEAVNQDFAERYGWKRAKRSSVRSDAAGDRRDRGNVQEGLRRQVQPEGVSAEGIHYSRAQRSRVDSSYFGTGIKGAEIQRVQEATDPRIKQRIYFYVDSGKGIKPEEGVGSHAHRAQLDNLYDYSADPLDLRATLSPTGFESAVLDKGFDGYVTHSHGIAVLLGERSVEVEYVGQDNAPKVAPAGKASPSTFGQQLRAVAANNALPAGEMTGAEWKRTMATAMPEIDVSHLDDARRYYKNEIVKRPEKFSPARQLYEWKSQTANAKGPIYRGDGFSLEAVRKHATGGDFQIENGLPWGHAAFVEDEAYRFAVLDANGRPVGFLDAEVNGLDEISAIHDMSIERPGSGLGSRIVESILASTYDGVRVIDVLPQSEKFWDRLGAGTYDINKNTRIDFEGSPAAARHGNEGGTRVRRTEEGQGATRARRQEVRHSAARDEIPAAAAPARALDDTELAALRRDAARLERPDDGIFLRVTGDGQAIAVGPKGARIPDTFRRFAADHRLSFYAGRSAYSDLTDEPNRYSGISIKSSPMPVNYRLSGALYFGEMGAETLDRTARTRFSHNREQTDTKAFKRWSSGAPVVPFDSGHVFSAGEPVVAETFHGTTADFTVFDPSKAYIEANLGGGIYSTNNPNDVGSNYAGLGPDLKLRIENEIERRLYDDEEDLTREDVAEEVRAQYMQHEGVVLPVFVRFDNPVVLGGNQETFLDYSEDYDPETDEYAEPTGTLVDFVTALRDTGQDDRYGDLDVEGAIARIFEDGDVNDNGGIRAGELIDRLVNFTGLAYAVDYEANDSLAAHDVVRKTFEGAGFDGFIDQTVGQKFRGMEGMTPDTVHFVAFSPNQVKSALGNSGDFSLANDDIRYSTKRVPAEKLSLVDLSEFGWNEQPDDYVYHVTSAPAAQRALKSGLLPNQRSLFPSAYASHIKGRVFFTERDGVKFWEERVENALFDRYDDPPEVAVLRVAKTDVQLTPDEIGTRDARHGASFVQFSPARLSQEFETKLQAHFKSKQPQPIKLADNTPASLQLFGWNDLPVIVSPNVVDKMHFDHGMTIPQMARLPYLLKRPLMIFADSENMSLVFVGEHLAPGKIALVAIKPETQTMLGTDKVASNMIVTGYAPQNGWAEVTKRVSHGELVYRDTIGEFPDIVRGALAAAQKKYARFGRSLPREILQGSALRTYGDSSRKAQSGTRSPTVSTTPSVLGRNYTVLGQSALVKLENDIWPDGAKFSPPREQTQTPEFKAWFGNSAVVDESGQPLVVYHGTNKDFVSFEAAARSAKTGNPNAQLGFFFSERPEEASRYAKDWGRQGGNVMPVYLSIRNPYAMSYTEFNDLAMAAYRSLQADPTHDPDATVAFGDQEGQRAAAARLAKHEAIAQKQAAERREELIREGYDGIVVRSKAGDEYIAFEPTQIKSAIGNSGAFSVSDPDIRFSPARSVLGALTPAQALAANNVLGTPKTFLERLADFRKDWAKNLKQGIFDQFAPIAELDPKAYILARLSKGGDSTLEALMLYGKLSVGADGATNVRYTRAGGLQGFASKMAVLKGEQERFMLWVAAQRADRLKAIGLENLWSTSDIATLKTLNTGAMKDGTPRLAIYAQAMRDLNDFNDNVLEVAVASGLIDDSTRQLYKDTPYVPFYRLQEDDEVSGFNVKPGLVNQYAWKRLKGGTSKLNEDLLANLLHNWSHLITASAKNRAAKATLDAATRASIAAQIPAGTPGKGHVSYKEAGQEKVFIVSDPHLLDAVAALEYAGLGPWAKPFSAAKHWLTLGVTANPAFKIRNLIRDSIGALGTAQLSYNAAGNLKQGWAATAEDSETRARMLASGGMIRFGSMLDGKDSQRAQDLINQGVDPDMILDSDHKIKRFYKRYLHPVLSAYNELGDRGEQVNRAALYEQLTAKGMDHAEAAFWARDLMDFSMSGKWTAIRTLTQTVPFFNARLQGLYKLGRAGKQDIRRLGYVLGTVSLASLALLLAYEDDEDWKRRSDADRNNYWWFKVGDVAFRVPKPFEIGAVGTLAERGYEVMFNPEMTGKRFSQNMRDIVMSQLSMNPTPQLFKPMMDLYANKDSFTGRDIESMGMERLRKQDRYDERTSEVARFLGSLGLPDLTQLAMGRWDTLSPKQIDFLARAYFSWLGVMTTTVIDYGIRPALDRGDRPALQLRDVFLVGNFVETLPSNSSRYVQQMYDQAREIEQAYASYRSRLKLGDVEGAREILSDERENILRRPAAANLIRAESLINVQIQRVTASPTLSGEVKRERLDALYARRNQLAESFRAQ